MQPARAAVEVARQTDGRAAAHPYARYVTDAAERFGIPERWIWAVMRVESQGNARAVSRAGAMGLMQIMPATWASLRARYQLGSDPFDPRDSILGGAAYLRDLHDRYGDVTAMLAAYNAGPGRTDDYLARGRPLPVETRAYLAKLASIIGSASSTGLAVASPPDPFAWRRASLFVRLAGKSAAASEEVLARQDGTRVFAISPRSGGIIAAPSATLSSLVPARSEP